MPLPTPHHCLYNSTSPQISPPLHYNSTHQAAYTLPTRHPHKPTLHLNPHIQLTIHYTTPTPTHYNHTIQQICILTPITRSHYAHPHSKATTEMKGTKVLTLGAGRDVLTYVYTRPLAIRMRYMCIYACAVLLIGGRAGPFYRFTDSWSLTSLLRVGHRVATLLDSTRESILALRYNFWRLQGTQSCSR